LIYLLIDSGVLFEVATTIDEILGIVALKKKAPVLPGASYSPSLRWHYPDQVL
jgi:hypothetical protein